jgi:hypothetical protein
MPPIVVVVIVVVRVETEYLKKGVFWEFADSHPWMELQLVCNAWLYNRTRIAYGLSLTSSTLFDPQLFPSTRNNHSRI